MAWQEENGGTSSVLVRRLAVGSNHRPTAVAGADQTVNEGTAVTLDGSASFDLDGTISAYQWSQPEGPAVALSGAASAVAGFTAPVVSGDTALTFALTVTDDAGGATVASVTVTVVMTDTDQDGLSDVWEGQEFGDLSHGPAEDPDADGLDNLAELQAGSDPNEADTDGDGIRDGVDGQPTEASNACQGDDTALLEDVQIANGETMVCAAPVSVTLAPTTVVETGGRLEVLSPRVRIQPGFAVPAGSEWVVRSVDPSP